MNKNGTEQEGMFLTTKRDPNKVAVDKCVQLICKNFGLPGVTLREVCSDAAHRDVYTVFIDLTAVASANFKQQETMVANPKQYKRIKRIVRLRLINAFNDLKTLAEESLRSMGVNNDV
jgi:hypothetical protein